jgi:superfamily II DNA or RNA helicase
MPVHDPPPLLQRWRVGARVRVRGRRWRVDHVISGVECTALQLTGVGADAGGGLTILTPFDRPVSLDRPPSISVVRPRRWLHDLDRALVDLHPFGSLAAAARTAIRLLPYQLEPALAVLRHGATRILIADAVGLGKTIQAGAILMELARRSASFRALVLVPAGLRDQWTSELTTHFSMPTIWADAAWLRSSASERPPGINPWSLPGTYVASHDFVKRPESLRPLEDVYWDLLVVDEAHAATSGTDRRTAIHAIACRAVRVVLLTATPHRADPPEFAALCRIGRTHASEGPALLFARSKGAVDGARQRKSLVLPVAPSEAEGRMHRLLERYSAEVWKESGVRQDDRARLVSIILRKRALSSAGSLASSVRRRLELLSAARIQEAEQLNLPLGDEDPLDDEEPLSALAVPGLADPRRERRWLAALAEAARTAARAETKARSLLRLLNRVQEPVIVFTEYRDTLSRLQRQIAATGRSIVVLHGGMSPPERHRVPYSLAAGAKTLLATDAAAEGLNLHHHCRLVVHYELPWNPERLEQRAGRVDRIGQARRVHEIALVSAATAERLVVAPLLARRSVVPSLVDENQMVARLTESAVAEAVMSGSVPPEGSQPRKAQPSQETIPADFREEAVSEARRLEHLRHLIRRSERDRIRALAGATISSTASLAPRGGRSGADGVGAALALVYVASVETGARERLHAETIVAQLDLDPDLPDRPAPRWLRTLVARYVKPADARLISLLSRTTRESTDRVSLLARKARQQIQRRRQAIAQVHQSAAGRLIQPQLFGRHARRDAHTSDEPATDPVHTPDTDSLHADISLVAALLRR